MRKEKKNKNFIKSQDIFGHKIKLNLQGEDHQTTFGGFVSIFLKLSMATYVMILLSKILTKSEDKISSTSVLQLFELPVNYN